MTKQTPLTKLAAGAMLVSLVLAACGGDDDADPAPATSAPAATAAPTTEPPTTNEPPATTTPATTEPPTTTPGTEPGTPATTAPEEDGDVTAVPLDENPWTRDASEFRGRIGEQFRYTCPAGGDVLGAAVWGTEIYTDDSAVCIAAVHVGLVNPEDGGEVTIVIEEGQDEYGAGTANGVTSARYGAWGGSFSFPDAPVGTNTFEDSLEAWNYTVFTFGLDEGATATVACPAGGELRSVWGSNPYTGDSSICTAAVHAGVFEHSEGGVVTIAVGGALDSYEGSEANGVTTSGYGAYGPSFEIVVDAAG